MLRLPNTLNLHHIQDCLQPLSMQALPAQPESLCIVEMGGVEKQDELGDKGTIGFLYLNIGLQVFIHLIPEGFLLSLTLWKHKENCVFHMKYLQYDMKPEQHLCWMSSRKNIITWFSTFRYVKL